MAEIIDFRKELEKRGRGKIETKPSQHEIEMTIYASLNDIMYSSSTESLPIRSPTLMVTFQRGLPAITYLFYHLPFSYQVNSPNKLDKEEKVALQLLMPVAHEVIDGIKEDIEKVEELRKLANSAPDPDYPNRIINDRIEDYQSRIEHIQEIIKKIEKNS